MNNIMGRSAATALLAGILAGCGGGSGAGGCGAAPEPPSVAQQVLQLPLPQEDKQNTHR